MSQRLGLWIAHFNVLAICGVLAGAFSVQFVEGELPCPLCVLQRMAMLLCALGPAFILIRARKGDMEPSDFAAGYGMSVLAAIGGAVIAGRQVLLHIVPPDPGFGDPVLGLHLYTWSLIVFLTVMLVSGVNLLFVRQLAPQGIRVGWFSSLVVWILGAMIAGNAVTVFCEEGFHWILPDSPHRYQLFHDLGWARPTTEETVQSSLSPLRVGGKPPAPVLNIAHRGARAFAPENTLESFGKAVEFGCPVIELDVHLSKDGELIVVHDDDLPRCSDVKTRFPDRKSYFVSDFTAAEIHTLDAGSWYVAELDKPADKRQPFLQSLTDQEIKQFVSPNDREHYTSGKVRHPVLREVLEFAKGKNVFVNIEIKTLPRLYPGIAAAVVRLVEELKMERMIIVSSFDHDQLAEVRQRSKVIATAALVSDRIYNPGRYVREILDGDAYNPGCYDSYDSLGFHSVSGKLDTEGIKSARAAGVGVNVWTENDPQRMKQLIEAGVTGIFTDYPNRLRDVLNEGGGKD
ncbi:MAG: disulfide bond formation protein B [Gemmataceae bacterium]|nr:disulfide bond formation protein B [Gemmataceae bacterium]